MNEYIALFKMKLLEGFQYRAAALAGVATQFFWGFMSILMFRAFYQSSPGTQPMPFPDLVSYMWLRQAFLVLFSLWIVDMELLDSVINGHVAYEYCRPYDLFWFMYARLASQRLASTLLRCLPILAVTSFLPDPWGMRPPGGAPAFFLFLASLTLSLALAAALCMFVVVTTFYTLNIQGSRLLFIMLGELFSGALIPVPLMPEWLQSVTLAMPFAYTADIPFRIYSGNIPTGDALIRIGIQIAWLAAVLALGKISFASIQRKVVIQGG